MVEGEIKSSPLESSVKCIPNTISKWMYQIGICIIESGIPPGRSQAQADNLEARST